ncbi:MAG: hypothetical protein CMP08_05875 [Xanthomonadales bacterium]|nr:hypothetical protein [Xanthomonadales bacterium]|tara:strand:+ start:66 stop:587 length:522 start_codon:yes stop_codon:yes gene_type:complete
MGRTASAATINDVTADVDARNDAIVVEPAGIAMSTQCLGADNGVIVLDACPPAETAVRVPARVDAVQRNDMPGDKPGVVDEAWSELESELLENDATRATAREARNRQPGAMCFFNSDKSRHRITPLDQSPRRIPLAFEYGRDAHQARWQRLVSNRQGPVAYFGFTQVFKRHLR